MLETTGYYDDFLSYYSRAKTLNLKNIGKLSENVTVDDELQQNVTIYDTVWRRYAGFSKVLEQLYYGPESLTQRKSDIAYKDMMNTHEWLYICLVHRLTGSGASFEKDHGYRNTLLIDMVENGPVDIDYWTNYIKEYDKPFFTSKGNQIPPFNKPTEGWDKGGRQFICEIAPSFSYFMAKVLNETYLDKSREVTYDFDDKNLSYKATVPVKIKKDIQPLVDIALSWLKTNGFKQYKFVVTAWVMDMAEYYPELVDQDSHCYMGKNAMRSLDLMYNSADFKKKEFYDVALDHLCAVLQNKPYNMEDVLCDSVRYWANYIPKSYENKDYQSSSNVERISLN